MLATIQLMSDGFAHPAADRSTRAARPTSTPPSTTPRRSPIPGGTYTDGHERRAVGLRQRAARARRRGRVLRDRPLPRDQPPRTRSSSPTAATTTPPLDRRRLGLAERSGPRSAPVLARRRRRLAGADSGSAAAKPSPATSPCSTCAGTKPTPSPAGAAPACPRRPSGRVAAAGAPVGAANLGHAALGAVPVGSRPDAASRAGCEQLLGDVWEWTATDFAGYPGFRSFPYREYSEVFFGPEYKVLRGGSWATDPVAMRTTFRNWDYPIRRQIFAGFRCARDA